MLEHQQIANVIASFNVAVDSRDWARAEALMTNPFHLDYSSFGGGEPADLAPRDILDAWAALLPGFDHTHHQIGNLWVEVSGDDASSKSYVTATHVIDDEVWTVVGAYEQTLRRSDEGWRLSGSRFLFKYQSGALHLPAEAQRRVAAAG